MDTFGHKGVVQGVVEYTDHVKSENFLVALVFPISYSNIQVEVVAFVVIHKEVLKESSTTQYQSVFFSLYNLLIKQLGSRAGYFHY